jgi:hypothetical protein
MKTILNFAHFMDTQELGMKQILGDQIKAQLKIRQLYR